MKHLYAISIALLITFTAYGQWNDNGSSMTTTDKVGIGSGSPSAPLHIFQTGPQGLRFDRSGHDRYEIKVAGSKGLYFTNLTDARQEMTFDGQGRIGIRTEAPAYTLDVNGVLRGRTHLIAGSSSGAGRLYLRSTSGSNKMLLRADGVSYFNAGNVGFGTASPTSPVHIYQSGPVGLRFERSGHDMYEIKVAGSKGIRITNLTDSREEMVFDGNGKVGIGTDTMGSHKLAVDGSIGAREIKVEVGAWSDFVFDANYRLPSLEEVESHIAAKGHLSEIPSEAEVLTNGINLGEMDAKLLQKIEELTLYLIEQNKQNMAQQKEIEALKGMNKKLMEQISGK